MKYQIVRRWGNDSDLASIDEMRIALNELDTNDKEHPDTWLTHESGWTLSCYEDGRVIWENDEEGVGAWHLNDVSRDKMLSMWIQLSEGKIDELKSMPWISGYGNKPFTEEDRKEIEKVLLASDLKYYDALVPQGEAICLEIGCGKKAVKRSVLCRQHHFEMIWKRKCPFSH